MIKGSKTLERIEQMQIYYDRDANLNACATKKIAVIGYGSQGFAQSNNLHESGLQRHSRLAPR